LPDFKLYRSAFDVLLNESLICITTATSHLSAVDRLMQLESEERALVKGVPATKQLREIQEKARMRLREEDEKIRKVSK